jgi:hypothetical protein
VPTGNEVVFRSGDGLLLGGGDFWQAIWIGRHLQGLLGTSTKGHTVAAHQRPIKDVANRLEGDQWPFDEDKSALLNIPAGNKTSSTIW